jgi:hypothetical protein
MNIKRLGLIAALVGLAALTGCGGGGGGGGTAAAPDSRNGTYTSFAGDGKQYTTAVDFDAKTIKFTNSSGNTRTLFFNPRGGTSTTQYDISTTSDVPSEGFMVTTDALIGRASLAEASITAARMPFIASRNFVTTVAEAAGTYNFLARENAAGGTSDTLIFPGEITAAGLLSTCFTSTIYTTATCPTPTRYNLSVSGSVFTGTTATTTVSFRIAKIGNERVYLRAEDSGGGNSRFTVGLIDDATFAPGTFDMHSSDNTSGLSYTTDGLTSFTFTGSNFSPAGPFTITGTGARVTGAQGGLRVALTTTDGNYFALRNSKLSVVVAARGNGFHQGFMMVGTPR